MADENWENLKEIFHAAVALPANERAAFIAQWSKGDNSLRQSIESLLESHEETNNFLDEPAYEAAAEMLMDGARLKDGQLVAHYKIISLLGEGGMGRVYLAEDTKLHRRVCLKFISDRFTSNAEWLQRFELEARAASVLNHPNILTIHEIGEAEGHPFIATEFIEGQTLRERLHTDLSINDALEIAVQIASALVAAHRVNVVHRDIKPENIMIRHDDGLVKVLDFGLAKVAGRESHNFAAHEDNENETLPLFETSAGAVMGTVAYMSPEQARGDFVDARADVWSLGVIMYEMISGAPPFAGATSDDVIAAILEKTPASLKNDVDEESERLDAIIQKALARNREQRYQTSQNLLADLRELQQALRLETINQGVFRERATLTGHQTAGSSSAGRTTKSSFGARSITHPVKTHRRVAIAIASLVCFAIVAAVAVYGWRLKHTTAAAVAGPSQIRSLAVLPLRSLDSGDSVLGVGIADAVIRKMSQTGKITVRPMTAVLKYAKGDTDSLLAGRELSADAILEGTVQRAGDRLRLTVNLLRTSDGVSIYSDNIDMTASDLFALQDKVAQQVASRLAPHFDSAQRAGSQEGYPTDPRAYEAYIRGVINLDHHGYDKTAMPQMNDTMNFFKQAIEIDPGYALAHAQLAFAAAWTASFIQPEEPKWADLARTEIKRAAELNPGLAETHIARSLLLWSSYEGYQNAEAIRELRLARQLNPNVATPDLAAQYGHVGLDDLARQEFAQSIEINPTSQSLKAIPYVLAYLRADPDGLIAECQKIPDYSFDDDENAPWYYLRKGRLDEAQKLIEERLTKKRPDNDYLLILQAILQALRGNFRAAQAKVPEILARVPASEDRHHFTYDAACIYALGGNSSEAVKWLKETAATGFPNYPLFARDPYLDRIRKAPEFVQFMSEQKSQWENYRQEFAD